MCWRVSTESEGREQGVNMISIYTRETVKESSLKTIKDRVL